MNHSIRLAVLAVAASITASATWIDLSTTASVSDFSQLAGTTTANTRWVNDYGSVDINTPAAGTTSYATGAGQLTGWFATQANSAVPSGGAGPSIVGASSTVTTANSLPFAVNAGAAPATGYNLLGTQGGATPADESLGMMANDTTGNIAVGVVYRNPSATAVINTLLVSYRGEQWRNSGAGAQSIEVSYAVFTSATSITTGVSLDPNTAPNSATSLNSSVLWRSAGGASTFTSPITGGVAGALDGNLAANSRQLSFNLSNLSLQPGGYVLLRFRDLNEVGVADHILSIDNVSVAIPEPSTWAAIVAVGAIAGGAWRRARRPAAGA